MAGTGAYFAPHLIGSTESSRALRTGAPFSARISTGGNNHLATTRDDLAAGPYCIYVGPIETASKETLEALYRQARDAYYSGDPLIVDDMFDRVELKLRWYGSKCVVKYPRCSLRRQSAYADAESFALDYDLCMFRTSSNCFRRLLVIAWQADVSQVFALASIWILFLAFGCASCFMPIIYTVGLAYQDAFSPGLSYVNQAAALSMLNGILFMTFGSVIGYPIAAASVKVLEGLWRNDLMALKGACPNCGEEVFAFVKTDQSNNSPHRANCHVCECLLEFRTKAEKSLSPLCRRWVYGRIYLVSRKGRGRLQRRD